MHSLSIYPASCGIVACSLRERRKGSALFSTIDTWLFFSLLLVSCRHQLGVEACRLTALEQDAHLQRQQHRQERAEGSIDPAPEKELSDS
jgi:hypothetical protein